MVLESNVASRRQFACLFPAVIFIALRALSHAHPTPLPWTSGVFDAEGLDDILQTIRIAYAKSDDVRPIPRELLSIPTGTVSASEPSRVRETSLSSAQSHAPPSC